MATEVTKQDIYELEGKIDGLISMLSGKTNNNIKALEIKEFIDKYSVVKTLLQTDTITSLLESINQLNQEIKDIQDKANIPLAIANKESQKIVDAYADDTTQLALNITDVKLFKTNVYDSFAKMYQYINSLNIDKKIEQLNTQIAFAKNLSKEIIAQKEKIQDVINKNKEQDQLLEKMDNTNKEQDKQISYANDLIVMLEKQVENYAFFAEEFNTIYITAKDFISEFAYLEEKLNYIVNRDRALEATVKSIVSYMGEDYANLHSVIEKTNEDMNKFMQDIISWTNDSLMFNNEVRAYNLSLAAYNNEMDAIRVQNEETSKMLDSIVIE